MNSITQDIKYLWGRLIIGNPPYGRCMNMAQKFYKKSVGIADHIAFILPISQFNNTRSMYEFDLVYSEDLGVQHYSDRDLHCCFNIYSRIKKIFWTFSINSILSSLWKLNLFFNFYFHKNFYGFNI